MNKDKVKRERKKKKMENPENEERELVKNSFLTKIKTLPHYLCSDPMRRE